MVPIKLEVNGKQYESVVPPRMTLSDFLRERLGLTGTHVGCEHGVCGACNVIMNGDVVRSCLIFAVQANGARIVTVEGLEADGKLHPLQEAFREHHALQCGFCTPGMLIAAYDLLNKNPNASEEEIRKALAGNLCRCTGYEPIIAAVQTAAPKVGQGGSAAD